MRDATSAVRRRAALLWLAVTTGTAGLVRALAPTVEPPGRDATFADLLVDGCAVAALVAAALLWVTATDVVGHQLRAPGTATRTRAGHPSARRIGPVRALLLAACGVAVVAGPAAARGGDGPAPSLDGLPLPDRASGASAPAARADDRPGTGGADRIVHVRTGDTLWAIAARALGSDASAADVASYWPRVHALNAAAIGDDPDLLRPGQQLRLPPAPR